MTEMIVHILADGKVVNSIVVEDGVNPASLGGIAASSCPEEVGREWAYDGTNWAAPAESASPPSLPELLEQARRLVEDHVNEVARTRRYTDAVSCASYVASTNTTWAAEAAAFVAWRDTIWAQIYALEDKALAGEISTVPTAEELIAGLPKIAWPEEQAV